MLLPYVGCTVKQLPAHLLIEAARTAVSHNPANDVPAARGLHGVQFIAMLTSKFWGSQGRTLGVSFFDLPGGAGSRDDQLRNRIIDHMNAWQCSVRFRWSQSGGEVRISRGGGGYWSYLGTDILHVSPNEPTMNLQGFTLDTQESECRRVVRHETGHTLGFPHEHMRAEIVRRINQAAAVAYFGRTQGWGPQEVRQQVLTPLDPGSIRATQQADSVSVMCYALPGEIMVDGQPVPGGMDIDPLDFDFAASLYPLPASPPPPPAPPVSPPPPAAAGRIVIDLAARSVTVPPGVEVKTQ